MAFRQFYIEKDVYPRVILKRLSASLTHPYQCTKCQQRFHKFYDASAHYLITHQDSNEVKEDKDVSPDRNCVSPESNYVSPESNYVSLENNYVSQKMNYVSRERKTGKERFLEFTPEVHIKEELPETYSIDPNFEPNLQRKKDETL